MVPGAYIAAYKGEFPFVPEQTVIQELCGIQITVEVLRYERECGNGIREGREMADVTLRKGGRVYTCECIDRHNWTNCFCPVTLAGETYLCFRKSLYGFTLLHTETFAETDYFPEKVLQGEESFIMADVLSADDLLFFYGCYWGCPYFYIIYDPASGRFLELYSLYPMEYENTLIVQEGTVHLQGKDQGRQEINVSLTIQEIKDLLRKKGTEDM